MMRRSTIFIIALSMLAIPVSPATEQRPGSMGFVFTVHRSPTPERPRAGWLTVRQVRAASPAERAGLRAGDLVVSLNGRDIDVRDDLDAFLILETVKPGIKTPLVVLRAGRTVQLEVVPARMTDAAWEAWKANVGMLRSERARHAR